MHNITPERLKEIVTFHQANPSYSTSNFDEAKAMLGQLIDECREQTSKLLLLLPIEEHKNVKNGDKINADTAWASRNLAEKKIVALYGRGR